MILPVYNAEKYVAEAIRSVLEQTYWNFQLIVIDDGSTDQSGKIIRGFADPRVRIVQFPVNRGLVAALNTGISHSCSEFVARMDADDVCLPRRLERQLAFLDANRHVVMCGTWTRQFGNETGVRRPPADPAGIRARLFFNWAMDHPSIMVRRSFLEHHGLKYREEFRHVEDFDIFFRASALGELANLPEILLRTRAHDGEMSVIHAKEQMRAEARLRVGQLRLLMPDVTREEEHFHLSVLNGTTGATSLPKAEQWLTRLREANRARGLYDAAAFRRELRLQLHRLRLQSDALGIAEIIASWRSPLSGGYGERLIDATGVLVRAARRFLRRVRHAVRQWVTQQGSSRRMPQA